MKHLTTTHDDVLGILKSGYLSKNRKGKYIIGCYSSRTNGFKIISVNIIRDLLKLGYIDSDHKITELGIQYHNNRHYR